MRPCCLTCYSTPTPLAPVNKIIDPPDESYATHCKNWRHAGACRLRNGSAGVPASRKIEGPGLGCFFSRWSIGLRRCLRHCAGAAVERSRAMAGLCAARWHDSHSRLDRVRQRFATVQRGFVRPALGRFRSRVPRRVRREHCHTGRSVHSRSSCCASGQESGLLQVLVAIQEERKRS